MSQRFFPYAVFGGLLAMAGLPIYIHAPKFYVDEYGASLAALGAVLFGLRLLDVVQDPVLGWLSRRLSDKRGLAVACATAVMALSMIGLFAVRPPVAPLIWFALMLAGLFSAFSFLTISFYAQGVAVAKHLPGDGHVRLAGWRETGALLGVSLASVLPVALLGVTPAPFAVFAMIFAALAVLAVIAMRGAWTPGGHTREASLRPILADPIARRLLVIALLNATPVAVSSTLFLFFVESRLDAPGWEGPLLLLFFLAAAASAPVWSRVAQARGAKWTLMLGMVLAIASFGWAGTLGAGDALAFAVICLVSGAALGADMTLLPALFAARTAKVAPEAAEGFGLWSFVSKFSLAFAAVVLLPLLDAAGFKAGEVAQSEQALFTLSMSYAVLPCVLKVGALVLLSMTSLDDVRGTALTRGTS
jgi:GPH family glycoside/pentoside/hexuronide:cation symporter